MPANFLLMAMEFPPLIMNFHLDYYVIFSINDYYFFDHDAEISNYFGLYKIGFGITVAKYSSTSNRKILAFTFGFTLNIYLLDVLNDKPNKYFNGQGWMGANSDTWFEGEPFSGFRATGHVFSIRVDEFVTKNVFLYQKIMFELVTGDEDHNDLCFLLGAGVTF